MTAMGITLSGRMAGVMEDKEEEMFSVPQCLRGENAYSSSLVSSTLRKASCGTSTMPIFLMRILRLPSF